jgi:diguanylate cyclase (GGDEF)-like protein
MNLSFFKTRSIVYLLLVLIAGAFLFNFLLTRQSAIMHQYFIQKPTSYNLERAERLSSSIYKSFKREVPRPDMDRIEAFVKKYNEIPFLSVNFIYKDSTGTMRSVARDVKEIDILSAEYVYPISYNNRELGTLLVYDINREYERGLDEYNNMLNITRIFFALLMVLVLSVLLYREYSTHIEHEKSIAEYQAVHDGLTGLYTQKYFKEHIQREISRAKRYKRDLSLIMCDIDHFKSFNDTYGHLFGDEVLRTVAGIIADNVRASDIVTRYGGEEFAILLVEAGPKEANLVASRLKSVSDQAIEVADRIKEKVAETKIPVDHTRAGVTISLGIASYDGSEDYRYEYLISQADHALYESKKRGRDRITIYDSDTREFREFT